MDDAKEDPITAVTSWTPEQEAKESAAAAITDIKHMFMMAAPEALQFEPEVLAALEEMYLAGFRDGQIELDAGRWYDSPCGPRNRG